MKTVHGVRKSTDSGILQRWPLHPAMGELLDAAVGSNEASEFRQHAAHWLRRHVGADAVLIAPLAGTMTDAGLVGLNPAWRARLSDGFERYGSDFAQIAAASVRWRGFVRDRDTDLVLPFGLTCGTAAALVTRGRQIGAVLLGRERNTRRFTDRECDVLNGVLPVLTMGEALHVAPALPVTPARSYPSVSPRERQVLEYLVLGLQNREIAAALGTSVNTVRKQLGSLFEKLEVASRAELVAVAMRDALVTVR